MYPDKIKFEGKLKLQGFTETETDCSFPEKVTKTVCFDLDSNIPPMTVKCYFESFIGDESIYCKCEIVEQWGVKPLYEAHYHIDYEYVKLTMDFLNSKDNNLEQVGRKVSALFCEECLGYNFSKTIKFNTNKQVFEGVKPAKTVRIER